MKQMRVVSGVLAAMATMSFGLQAQAPAPSRAARETKSFYDLKTNTLDGKPADLSQYKGSVSLVVNVASKCGYTPQYKGLEALYREMKPKGLNILGFPSNDFAGQEPGTPEEIATFCKANYDVTFPLFEKVVTRLDANQSPVYGFLWTSGYLPAWNFGKYVINKDGTVAAFFPHKVTPEDPALRAALAKALAQ
jgi:glutathione peroxidase